VDPTFTLGKESQRRIQIIQKLKEKDLFDANAKRHLPGVIQNIAVISSETAAGYADFLETLGNSPFKIAYRTTLFQASMQGNNTESEVCSQLENIQEISAKYDLIVIIRGGGGSMDLRYFDNLPIAIRIAESDLPVWTGIGHATDQTVVDLVAHTSCKTPTAVAQQIDEYNRQFLYRLEAAKTTITELARVRLMDGYSELNQIRQELSFMSKSAFDKKYNVLNRYQEKLEGVVKTKLEKFFIDIHQKKQRLKDLHPSRILERGYVALEQGEERIYRITDFKAEEVMNLTFSDGTLSVKPKNVSQ
jgi:exodeoxyribonuclease VII large subunit